MINPNFTVTLPQIPTLVQLLRDRVQSQPEQTTYTFLVDGEQEEATLTNAQLDLQARTIASHLQKVTQAGERALLLYPPSLDYVAAFFGCLYADVIAVPAYPPNPAALQRTLPRLQAIIKDAQAQVVLTVSPILSMAEFLFGQAPDLQALTWIATDELDEGLADSWQPSQAGTDTLAFLQYTSGSTGNPKGVMLSHGNLLDNSAHIHRCFGHSTESQGVIWLPPYHDMGLIGGILQPLYGAFPVTLLSPLDFLKRPLRWLEAISKYKATTSGGPNFAYDLCVKKVKPHHLETLDLSHWDLAFNGAEPIRPETLRSFTETFAPCGFKYNAFYTCYGLAEATLIASGGDKPAEPIMRSFDVEQMSHRKAILTEGDGAQQLVGSGQELEGQKLVIANPQTKATCTKGEIGEIWVQGPSIAQGYWGNKTATQETFQARLADNPDAGAFMRTGDLGFLWDGELFVNGRIKDLIIIRGQNHYPQDIERTVEESHPALRPGCGAAFAVDVDGEEQLVVVQELDQRNLDTDPSTIINNVRERIATQHTIRAHAIVLIEARSIPKTSSGKIQRYACRDMYLEETLDVVEANVIASEPTSSAPPAPEPSFIMRSLQAVPDLNTRQTLLTLHLQQEIATLININATQIDPQKPLAYLGLDSLQSIEIAYSVEEQLGVELSMATVLQAETLTDLAGEILQEMGADIAPPPPPAPITTSGTFSLASGQKALWYLQQLAPQNTAYHLPRAVRLRSKLDGLAMEQALSKLVARHAALRTQFTLQESAPVQIVSETAVPDFTIIPAQDWTEAQLQAALTEEAERPFNLQTDSLLRVRAYDLGEEAVILLVLHHIITDFWSLVILVDELSQLYMAERDRKTINLPTASAQYPDYVAWQTEQLDSTSGKEALAYWQAQLAGHLPTLTLPTDQPRPAVQSYNGAHHYFQLPADLSQQLFDLAQQEGVTPYTLLLTAYNVLLARYSGQDEIIVGSPTTGRPSRKWLDGLGYFVNPVAIRSEIDNRQPFDVFLQTVHQTVLGAFAHQQVPFPLLVETLNIPRHPSHSPIFQTMFVWQKAQNPEHEHLTGFAFGMDGIQFEANGLALASVGLVQQAAQFDLTLTMGLVDGQIAGVFEYNSDLFQPETIHRLTTHWQMLLQGVVVAKETAVSHLPLLPQSEKQQLLHTWNQTNHEYPLDTPLHELFTQQVSQTPSAPALQYEGQTLTYTQLNERANQLAHHLIRLGVTTNTLVGLYMERSIDMVVGMYAILKAGGAYVPIDPTYPAERVAFMLEDAGLNILLTQEQHQATVPNTVPHALAVDTLDLSQQPTSNPDVTVDPSDLAYMIYTSGSTGKPKGAMNSHRGIVNRLLWMQSAYDLDATDKILQKTPFSFDVSVWEFFWPLITGAQLVMARPGGHLDSTYLRDIIQQQAITTMHFVPSMLQIFLDEPKVGDCTSLRRVICSGEALPSDLQDRFFSQLSAELHNLYGPTEAAIDVTYWQCQQGEAVPIGKPIHNVQLYVLDGSLQPVPVGVAGELHIGGVALARGYHKRPSLTAHKFIPDPFHPEGGQRLYKTGDLVRYLPDGNIEFLGRIDFQVKVRGFRIELGEIETQLTDHPAIKETVVVVHQAGQNDQRLVAYLTSADDTADLTATALRTYLQDKLPDYMIPTFFVTLDSLPLSPNGKVNRRALPAPKVNREDLGVAYAEPRSLVEQKIADVWRKVLNVEKVGLYDNFFDLGGHSLLLVQVHRHLQTELEQDVPLVKLLEQPTIHGLAHYLDEGQAQQAQALQKSAERADKQRASRRRNRGGRR